MNFILNRRDDLDLIRVHLVEQQGYYLIDVLRSPVVEWSPGYDPTRHRSGRGRLWFPTGYWDEDDEFVQMPSGFLGWGDRLLRWVRRNFRKGPSGFYESPPVDRADVGNPPHSGAGLSCEPSSSGAGIVVLADRVTSVPFTAVLTGLKRTATDNVTPPSTCTVPSLHS